MKQPAWVLYCIHPGGNGSHIVSVYLSEEKAMEAARAMGERESRLIWCVCETYIREEPPE